MKKDEDGSVRMYVFSAEETDAVMADMARAAKADNLAALKKCAGLLAFLYNAFKNDDFGSFEPFDFEGCEFDNVQQFNAAWKKN
jgi:hypothetical protein